MRHVAHNPVELIRESILKFREDDGMGVSAETAYRLVVSLPALVIVFTSVSSIIAEYTGVDIFNQVLDRAREALPFEVFSTLELILESIEEQSGFAVLSIGLIVALWSGSNAINALVKGINRAHGVEDVRGFLKRRAVALLLLVGLGALMLVSLVLLIFGSAIRDELGNAFGLGGEFNLIWNIARWVNPPRILSSASLTCQSSISSVVHT
jgi:membrane protein